MMYSSGKIVAWKKLRNSIKGHLWMTLKPLLTKISTFSNPVWQLVSVVCLKGNFPFLFFIFYYTMPIPKE